LRFRSEFVARVKRTRNPGHLHQRSRAVPGLR
jgi:hypothetical protein